MLCSCVTRHVIKRVTYSHFVLSSRASSSATNSKEPIKEFKLSKALNYPQFGSKIYNGTGHQEVKTIKTLSFATSGFAICVQPVVFWKIMQGSMETPSMVQLSVSTMLSLLVLMTPVILHMFVRRYVVDMYYDKHTKLFTAITPSFLLAHNSITFSEDDVDVCPDPGMFGTINVRGRPLLFVPREDLFSDVPAFKTLMNKSKSADFHMQKRLEIKIAAEEVAHRMGSSSGTPRSRKQGRVLGKKAAKESA